MLVSSFNSDKLTKWLNFQINATPNSTGSKQNTYEEKLYSDQNTFFKCFALNK